MVRTQVPASNPIETFLWCQKEHLTVIFLLPNRGFFMVPDSQMVSVKIRLRVSSYQVEW